MNEYDALSEYYKDCFMLVDCFHFNSNVSKTVYTSVSHDIKGEVIPITHCGIKDNRRVKPFDSSRLRIGFIGSEEPFKGLPFLISVLESIGKNEKLELSVWGGRAGRHPSLPIYYKGKFHSDMLESVYDNMDVLIVPSIWKETFSLVTLEALSYAVPVIVSDNVGAQDLIKQYNQDFVYSTKTGLKNIIVSIIQD